LFGVLKLRTEKGIFNVNADMMNTNIATTILRALFWCREICRVGTWFRAGGTICIVGACRRFTLSCCCFHIYFFY
jgi:hypothetical protein